MKQTMPQEKKEFIWQGRHSIINRRTWLVISEKAISIMTNVSKFSRQLISIIDGPVSDEALLNEVDCLKRLWKVLGGLECF